MTLTDAFAVYKALPRRSPYYSTADLPDGGVAVALLEEEFVKKPPKGVMRHESRRSEWDAGHAVDNDWLARLPGLFEQQTPLRLVIRHPDGEFSVRPTLVGRVTVWDGEHLQIDFVRAATA